jgi:aldose 1-epimerase
VSDPQRFTSQVEFSAAFRWVQASTGDIPDPRRRRRGLAVEPQTCPPNALATGQDLLRLQPGQTGAAW